MRLLVIYGYFYHVTKQRERFRERFEFGTKPLWSTFKTNDSKEKQQQKAHTSISCIYWVMYEEYAKVMKAKTKDAVSLLLEQVSCINSVCYNTTATTIGNKTMSNNNDHKKSNNTKGVNVRLIVDTAWLTVTEWKPLVSLVSVSPSCLTAAPITSLCLKCIFAPLSGSSPLSVGLRPSQWVFAPLSVALLTGSSPILLGLCPSHWVFVPLNGSSPLSVDIICPQWVFAPLNE